MLAVTLDKFQLPVLAGDCLRHRSAPQRQGMTKSALSTDVP